jgi:hypothetical protein
MKFNRSYILKIETGDNEFVEIIPPFTLEFNIQRNNLASSNTGHFVIYNLNTANRSKIYKDIYDVGTFRAVQLWAGYAEKAGDLIPLCFNGNIKRAFSHRQGPDFRTELECYDGQISNTMSDIGLTLPAQISTKGIIEAIAKNIKEVSGVTVGNKFTDLSNRSTAIMGNPSEILSQLTGNQSYIDSGNLYALNKDEVVLGDIRLINVDNGLLGTPKKQETMVEIEMLFEPRIKPSQLIELQSTSETRFNGYYKVTGIIHKGTISGAIGGDARTNLTMIQQKVTDVVFDKATNEYRVTIV